MQPPIRPAAIADVPALHAFIERCYRGDAARTGWSHEADLISGPRTTAEALTAIIADPAQVMLVALAGDAIIGCVQLSDQGGGIAYLGQLAVEPGVQAQGLGRHLIATAESMACDFGATVMEMTVVDLRPELIAYYGRRGYLPTGEERAMPDGIGEIAQPLRLLVLAKPLSS